MGADRRKASRLPGSPTSPGSSSPHRYQRCRLSAACGSGRSMIRRRSGARCGITSIWVSGQTGARRRRDAGRAVVSRRPAATTSTRWSARPDRSAGHSHRRRGRRRHRAVLGRGVAPYRGIRAHLRDRSGVEPGTGWSATCPTSPRRSSPSWRPRASARSGAPADRTTRQGGPRPARSAGADGVGDRRRLRSSGASPTTRAPISPQSARACPR